MTISLMENNQTIAQVEGLAAKMLKRGGLRAKRLERSGNAQVFVLEAGGETPRHVVKFYFRHPDDPRDRLETEFAGFSFLWGQGIASIPRPVAVNREESCAIYEFIEGDKILPADITTEDIKYAVNFLADLKRLNNTARSSHIAPASDACFSISAIVAGIERRLDRLTKITAKGQEYEELGSFLREDFKPFLGILTQWAKEQCSQKRIFFDSEVPWEERTLSPSDFGFHNAIRARDGRIVFLDFEYFGWDDPSKMVVDFLLHPAMTLSESMKKCFARGMLDVFKENKGLIDRLRVVYPLHGLKWCVLLLNEFIPNDFSRRSFAAGNPLDPSQVRRQQLLKAKNFYGKIREIYEDFPYAIG